MIEDLEGTDKSSMMAVKQIPLTNLNCCTISFNAEAGSAILQVVFSALWIPNRCFDPPQHLRIFWPSRPPANP